MSCYRGWFQFGDVELVNTARTVAYMRAGECRTTASVAHDDSWPDTNVYLGQEPYTDAATDRAPWYTPDVPASEDFYGVWPMVVDGLDSAPVRRDVVESAGHGAAFGTARAEARVIRVEALVLAGTPEGGAYGLQWLSSVLRGDQCATPDVPRELRYLEVVPPVQWGLTAEQLEALAYQYERWVYSVACTEPVQVTERFGQYLPHRRQTTCYRVEFELTAGNPWVWKAPRAVTDPIMLAQGDQQTVRFEHQDADGNCPSACVPENPPLVDPDLPVVDPLPRPVTPAAAVGCAPIDSRRSRVVVPADTVQPFETMVPNVVIQTGGRAERYVRVQWSRGVDTTDMACHSIGEVIVGYIPANSTFVLDGVSGEARCDVGNTGVEVDATAVVSGRQGGPWRAPELRCGDEHTLTVDTERDVDSNTVAVVTGMVRNA